MSIATLFGADERPNTFPPIGDGAYLIAMTFQRLGGMFSIDSKGRRGVGKPLGTFGAPIPQLCDAEPHEQFHNKDEWQGALKLLDALLRRMDDSDTALVYDALACTAIDARGFVPSIEEPTRRAL